MQSIYRNAEGQGAIRDWCAMQLDHWPVAHERSLLPGRCGETHLVTAGRGPSTVVLVPGTNFNAATFLPLAGALAVGHRVLVADLPGQPGLSAGQRPRSDRVAWYGKWLADLLDAVDVGPVVVVGHSLGAAVALSCASRRISGLVLVNPAGLIPVRLTLAVLAATMPWLIRPGPASSGRLLRLMLGPGHPPSPALVDWMTLVARHTRTSGAPGPLPAATLARQQRTVAVLTGEHDVFFPPRRLAPATARLLGTDLQVIPAAGHLASEQAPDRLATVVTGIAAP